jgi:hypothetical protein
MTSQLHEWLIDQVVATLTQYPDCLPLRRRYPRLGGSVEAALFHPYLGLDIRLRADAYIDGDGDCDVPVFVEAGTMTRTTNGL